MLPWRQLVFRQQRLPRPRNLPDGWHTMPVISGCCVEQGKLVAFVDGFCTDTPDLTDEMYADAALHDENGAWQMIFGVNTLPGCRRRGYAGLLLQRAIADARAQGRKGLVLTCKEKLLHYYAKFGFVNEGVSASTHGGVVWYQMRLRF